VNQYHSFVINNLTEFKQKMLNWANRFNIFCLLDNQQYDNEAPAFECLLAVGDKQRIEMNAGNAFEALKFFYDKNPGWLFGHFGYDLKNETEELQSAHFDGIGFADMHFFVPQLVLKLSATEVKIFGNENAGKVYADIMVTPGLIGSAEKAIPEIRSRFSKAGYVKTVEKLQQHILRGDCYEINFCQEFFADEVSIDPLKAYHKLSGLSPNPFAALYKTANRYCLCASPERYLKKTGDKLVSQPIKGTSKRDLHNADMDLQHKKYLSSSAKEKSENVMVVDLVRNDLSKICKEGTVKVDELFGVYSFPQVHQLISTVSGELEQGVHWTDAIKSSFPMGSMTGAPKKKVMELIERYEQTKRGLFSGAIGFVDPRKDFDFNVVIRSIFYNASTGYLSFQTGSAITFSSIAALEYEECLLKAEAIMKVLG
jgi:para-aminobenzoate synthetase component I